MSEVRVPIPAVMVEEIGKITIALCEVRSLVRLLATWMAGIVALAARPGPCREDASLPCGPARKGTSPGFEVGIKGRGKLSRV